eukprot:scaffold50676_cov58-Phaeocystis_antarctica.AAC.2
MNGNSGYRPALCADWPRYWPARRAAAQQRLQLCSGWAGCTNQCKCSSHRRLRARARIDEGLMRDTAEASVTHHAARLIPPAGGPSRSAGSVAPSQGSSRAPKERPPPRRVAVLSGSPSRPPLRLNRSKLAHENRLQAGRRKRGDVRD